MRGEKLGSWSVPESPISVEYSLVAVEEIRHQVAEGFRRLSRGGIEVGGVLYGTREGRAVHVLAVRPIACEHARGPAFVLSDRDRIALEEQLLRDLKDGHLEGLVPVGWFLSHTRSEIMLSDSDLETYSMFFPAPWQVTLVIRPGRGGSMRAGFFVREADGAVRSERSYLEFNFPDGVADALERQPDRSFREPSHGVERRLPGGPQRAEPPILPPSPTRLQWPWLAASAVALAAVVLGLRHWMPRSSPEPIALAVSEREGQLEIEWNHSARSVSSATLASLEILDGAEARTVSLSPQVLAGGKFNWRRKTGDVEIRMTVQEPDGSKVQEASRFISQPPASANADELTALQRSREALKAEVNRLRQQNGASAARIRQLERTLRILQTRPGMDSGKQQ